MAATLTFARVVPAQHVRSSRTAISDTIEGTLMHFEVEGHGFTVRTWWPGWAPGNPAALPFIRPVWYSWSYTDQRGYLRNLFDVSSLSMRNALRNTMPMVRPDKVVDQFRLRVDAKDTYGQRASALQGLTVHRPVEVERRAERDRNAPGRNAIIEAVSGIYPGPAKVTYTETQACSFQRTYTQQQSTSVSVPLVAINLGFGFDVTVAVSSADEHAIAKNVESCIGQGEVGVWFRKAQPYERHADVLEVDELGNRTKVSELVVLDCLFSIYLGRGIDEAAAGVDARRRLA